MALTHKQLSYRQVIVKSEAELTAIDKALAEQESRVKALDAEAASINARWQSRTTELTTALETAATRSEQYEKLRAQDDLSAGTLDAGVPAEQLRICERELRKAQKVLADIEARARTEDAHDQAKLQELSTKREQSEAEIDGLQKRKLAVQSVIETKQREMGLEEQRDVLSQLALLTSQFEAKRVAFEQAAEELRQFADGCPDRLAQWPDLQDEAKRQLPPYNDAATQLIEGAIALLDNIISDGAEASKEIDVEAVRNVTPLYGHGLPRLLDLAEHELVRAFAGNTNRLQERRDMLIQVLETYRQYKRR
jgi:hypothetical protein